MSFLDSSPGVRFNPFRSGNQQGLGSHCSLDAKLPQIVISLVYIPTKIISIIYRLLNHYHHCNPIRSNIYILNMSTKKHLWLPFTRDFPKEVVWLLDLSGELRRSKGLQIGPGQGFNPLKYQSSNMAGKSFANGGLNGRKTWPTTYMWVINGGFSTEFNDFQKQSLHPSLVLTDSHLFVDSSLGPVSS